MKQKIASLLLLFALVSCGKIKETAKESINKSGETVGKTATEFFEGVTVGVEKTLECELKISQELIYKGVKTGKFSIDNLPGSSNKNLLTLYLIFDKDFKSPITAKVFDKSGLEIGRAKLEIESKADSASYFDFAFDKRTHIEIKSKILLE